MKLNEVIKNDLKTVKIIDEKGWTKESSYRNKLYAASGIVAERLSLFFGTDRFSKSTVEDMFFSIVKLKAKYPNVAEPVTETLEELFKNISVKMDEKFLEEVMKITEPIAETLVEEVTETPVEVEVELVEEVTETPVIEESVKLKKSKDVE